MRASAPRRRRILVGRLETCFLCDGGRVFVVFGRPVPCPFCGGRGRIPVATIGGKC